MHRFWNRYIGPLIATARPARVLEIGAEWGWNTRHVLAYCRLNGAQADVVDALPQPELYQTLAGHEQVATFHPLKSLDVIPQLRAPDFALLDGDHNWYTVYHEFELLYALAREQGVAPPITVSHDVAWPYARRDMYYDPESLRESDRHPYACVGMLPDVNDLVEEGVNGSFANAMYEGGPRNGVLTGIEDFLSSTSVPVDFYKLPFYNGLGIVIPRARMTKSLHDLIESFYTRESLVNTTAELDRNTMHVRAQLLQAERRLARRTEALQRARLLLEQKNEEIAKLRKQLGQVSANEVAT